MKAPKIQQLTFYFLLLMLAISTSSNIASAQVFGDVVKIKHVLTNTHLHSHAIAYSHPQSSGQQQVTAFGGADDNDYWVIKPEHGNNNRSGSIRHGDIIRLQHWLTGANLHSHAGIPSPVTQQQEVTCFGSNGEGDSNDNWRIEIEGGSTWAIGQRIRLIHVNTNQALHSHAGYTHPVWTTGQQEVTAGGRDDNDLWQLTEIKTSVKVQPVAANQKNRTDTKTVEVKLNGIFMGECGNPKDCRHEPVAGEVHIYLIDKTTGAKIVSTNSVYTLWNSNQNYNLICDKYRPATGYGYEYSSIEDGIVTPASVAENIEATLYYTVDQNLLRSNQYEFVIQFNLGSPHKDNDFASTGYHWLTEGRGKIEAKMDLPTTGTSKRRTLGPYETQSNRCHEYYLQFDMNVY